MCSVPPNRFQPNGHLQIQRLPNLQLAKWKPPPAPGLTAVLHLWGFFGNKAEKLYIFAKKAERGGKRGDGLFDPTASSGFSLRPPEEWTDYHRLSGRKRSCRISTRPGEVRPLDADKAFPFFFIKRLVEKTNPKKLQCGEDRAVRPNAAKWLNYQNG